RRHTRLVSDWSSDVCSSDLQVAEWVAFPEPDPINHGLAVRDAMDLIPRDAERNLPRGRPPALPLQVARNHADFPVVRAGPVARQIGRASCREREWGTGDVGC